MVVKMKRSSIRDSKGDRRFHTVVVILMSVLAFLVLYPLWFMIIASVSNPDAVLNGEVWILPDVIDLNGYIKIFQDDQLWIGYRNTLLYTALGTFLNLVLTIPAGYALSRPTLPYRKVLLWVFIITMFFGGGLIPYFYLISNLGLIDSIWVLILPQGISVWNMFMESMSPKFEIK